MGKVMLIGLDCGNPNLILKWIDDLPTFKRLIGKGTFNILKSTIPAATIPAWNSIFSGKNPGNLGLYDFVIIPSYIENGLKPANYLYAGTSYLWDILSTAGKRQQIINIPVTYPPAKINGIMVSGGLLAPLSKGNAFTFPSTIKEEIDRISGGYEILPFTDLSVSGKEKDYLRRLLRNVDKQVSAVTYLMTKYDWDFLSYVFFVTDSVQHYFWHHFDETHPWYDRKASPRWKDSIKQVYMKVDEGLAKILALCPPETDLLIVSDHGSGPLYGTFMVNTWLEEQGFLKLNHVNVDVQTLDERIIISLKNFLIKKFPSLSEKLVAVLPKSFLNRFLIKEQYQSTYSRSLSKIDWTNTKAYGLGSDGSIYLNLKGREPSGIVDTREYEALRNEIVAALKELKGPDGKGMPLQVFFKEEVYKGTKLAFAPDIIFVLDEYKYLQRMAIENDHYIWKPPEIAGGHSLSGLFLAYGPNIKQTGIDLSRVYSVCDIMPTILHLMNVSIPSDIDGMVLSAIFKEDSELATRRPSFKAYEKQNENVMDGQVVYSKEEEDQINQRLKNLGYV